MPNGYNVLNSTDPPEGLRRSPYLSQLAERREREEVRQLTSFGLTMGWLFTLVGGFCWFCVISQIDWFWRALMTSGLLLLVLGTVLPQALAGPHRLWMGLAHLQGRLVMTVLLTVVYVVMIVPLGWYQRRRQGGGAAVLPLGPDPASPEPASWDHRLGNPFPQRVLPDDDSSPNGSDTFAGFAIGGNLIVFRTTGTLPAVAGPVVPAAARADPVLRSDLGPGTVYLYNRLGCFLNLFTIMK